MYGGQKNVLIADSDPDYIWLLKMDPKAKLRPPLIAGNEREVIELLEKKASRLSAIFLNPNMPALPGSKMFEAITRHCPAAPVFYVAHRDQNTSMETSGVAIRRILQKPVSYSDLLRIARLYTDVFDPEAALQVAAQNKDQIGQVVQLENSMVSPIRAEQFVAGTNSFFDVYTLAGPGSYKKIVQAGEQIRIEQLRLAEGGLPMPLFLRRDSHEHYLRYCDHIVSLLLKKNGVPQPLKSGFLFNQGEETLAFIRQNGLTGAGIQYARRWIENVRTMSGFLLMENPDLFLQVLFDNQSFSSEVLAVLISFMLCKRLGLYSDRSLEVVGLATLLQNIGLADDQRQIPGTDLNQLSEEERHRYQQHPLQSAALLRGLEDLDPAVIQAVEQHHERKGKKGFPQVLAVHLIGRISEVVGFSDELALYLKQKKSLANLKNLYAWEMNVTHGFSIQLAEAFRELVAKKGDK